MYSEELNHHGIKGMKWGKKNGPPYTKVMRENSKWMNNCTFNTTVYELMKRGLDVSAGPTEVGKSYTTQQRWFKGGKFKYFSAMSWSEMASDALRTYPNGSRGNICVQWKPPGSGGHSMIWEIADGKFIIRDGQINRSYTSVAEIQKALSNANMSFIAMMRTDHLELNIPELIKDGVIDPKKFKRR